MFRFIANLLAVGCVSLLALAGDSVTVRRDTQFPVEVRHTISASSAKTGDTVEFRTEEAVLIGNNIVVPAKAKLLATITEVRRQSAGSPSVLRIRIHTLQWKNGQAPLNAMVQSIQRLHPESADWSFHRAPTFLEGIRVVSYLQHEAYTEFTCDKKDVVIRSGLSFTVRQVDPNVRPEREYTVYSPENERAGAGW